MALDRRPLIDLLRERVGSADWDWLRALVGTREDAVAGLAASLLRHQMDAELFGFYAQQWVLSPPYLKNRLMWRMLDSEELPTEWHHHFFEFVRQNWTVFRDFNVAYYGGRDVALSSIVDRLGDPTFPVSKKWIYACCVPEVVPSGRAARSLLALARQVGDGFASKVVDYLEHRFPVCDDGQPMSWEVPHVPSSGNAVQFVAQAVIDRLRAGERPGQRCGYLLNNSPLIAELQARVRLEDLAWIRSGVEADRGEGAGLFLSLLKAHARRDDIRVFLRSSWNGATPLFRAHMMWLLLDDPDLPEEWHYRICDFVFSEWEVFRTVSLRFFGPPRAVVNQALKRMMDPVYPETKRWVYLCRIVDVGADDEAVRAVLLLAQQIENNHISTEVATRLLSRFYGSSA